ncbi:hypothetical protein [Roseivirga sp.]|uniref:hypothetical protein n=1 Tax=Roseivirga sp. TaxID=1964215 RepID=UPI002B270B5A|nr:hypothetical protein [Roseivirga sp.]
MASILEVINSTTPKKPVICKHLFILSGIAFSEALGDGEAKELKRVKPLLALITIRHKSPTTKNPTRYEN